MSVHRGGEDHVRVDRWLRGLGAKAGLSLRLDDEGVCAIGHSSGLDCAIELPDGAESVYLRAPLLHWPPRQLASIAECCLTSHYLGLGTEGASFAIDSGESELVLWKAVPLAVLDETKFGALIIQFIDMGVRWRDELGRVDQASTPAAGDARGPESPLFTVLA